MLLGWICCSIFKTKEVTRSLHSISDSCKSRLTPTKGHCISSLTDEIANGMKGNLLIICTSLNHNIPTSIFFTQLLFRKRWQIPKHLRTLVFQVHLFQETGRHTKSQGQTMRIKPYCLSSIARRQESILAIFFDQFSLDQLGTIIRPILEQLDNLILICRMQVQDNKIDIFLHGRTNPSLMFAIKSNFFISVRDFFLSPKLRCEKSRSTRES